MATSTRQAEPGIGMAAQDNELAKWNDTPTPTSLRAAAQEFQPRLTQQVDEQAEALALIRFSLADEVFAGVLADCDANIDTSEVEAALVAADWDPKVAITLLVEAHSGGIPAGGRNAKRGLSQKERRRLGVGMRMCAL